MQKINLLEKGLDQNNKPFFKRFKPKINLFKKGLTKNIGKTTYKPFYTF